MSTNPTVHREAWHLLADNLIGSGMSRNVYDSKILPNSVIKIEEASGSFQNVLEWEAWHHVKGTLAEKWLAPCEWISPCGLVLIMAKTLQPHKFPDKMPAFLTDFKRPNYGIYKGRLVCHDYGTSLFMTTGITSKMRKANWW